jgi:hypothetical protein
LPRTSKVALAAHPRRRQHAIPSRRSASGSSNYPTRLPPYSSPGHCPGCLWSDFLDSVVAASRSIQTRASNYNYRSRYNYVHVSHATLAAAEREANKILGAAGAQAAWIECLDQPLTLDAKDLCQKGWTAQIPGLRLISGSNKFQDAEFASTAIPVLSTIYYEKIARRAHRENADAGLPVFLGCVVAHELGHILLGDPVHSASGIMQPEWGHPQIHQALTGNLLFTRQQATRIQAQVHLLANLRPTADPALPSSTP